MNTQTQEALKMAQEVLNLYCEQLNSKFANDALKAINEALAQPAQEPVAWIIQTEEQNGKISEPYALMGKYKHVSDACDFGEPIPLYTHPAPSCQECENLKHDLEGYMDANKALINREWQGLRDDEINALKLLQVSEAVIRAIEQALKEKNT